ncbi:hypothetical protein BaRGS_00005734 [Batillaria attramentaria]|uniref:Secreted protein n=1 Tax=Batillaria attramentaria TaxID=370345 RepID=A0ABD0LUP5_9CAEN
MDVRALIGALALRLCRFVPLSMGPATVLDRRQACHAAMSVGITGNIVFASGRTRFWNNFPCLVWETGLISWDLLVCTSSRWLGGKTAKLFPVVLPLVCTHNGSAVPLVCTHDDSARSLCYSACTKTLSHRWPVSTIALSRACCPKRRDLRVPAECLRELQPKQCRVAITPDGRRQSGRLREGS